MALVSKDTSTELHPKWTTKPRKEEPKNGADDVTCWLIQTSLGTFLSCGRADDCIQTYERQHKAD